MIAKYAGLKGSFMDLSSHSKEKIKHIFEKWKLSLIGKKIMITEKSRYLPSGLVKTILRSENSLAYFSTTFEFS